MANQIVVSAGAKVRNLSGVLTATSGVVSFLPIDVSLGIPQLDVNGKILVSQLPNSVMEYKGTWNANTNTPTLANGTGNQGDVYLCNVAGTVDFGAGAIAFVVGDQVIYSGSIWQRASGATGTVTSVAVTESGDSLNITGSPITTSGTINIGFNGTNLQYVNGAGNLTTFPILTGYVPYTGATQDVDLGAFKLNAQSLHIKGTAGNGHLGLKHQSASATASANEVSLFADSLGDLSWQNANLYLSKFITSANTANRSYTFPNANGTVALTSDLANYVDLTTAQTIGGTKTFTDATKNNGGIFLQNASSNSLAGYMNIGGLTNGVKFTSGGGVSNTFTLPSATGYTFTFPNATGTVALTSDIPSITGLVPYTGATASVDLGAYLLTASGIDSVGYTARGSGTLSGYLIIKQGTTYLGNVVGYNSINANARKYVFISDVDGTNYKSAIFELSSLTNNTARTYTLPDASGTLALTSDLTGGTVTSVAMTVPTGLSVSGSPITTSGTLAVSLASGYSIPTTSSQATWDTAYSLRITTASLPLVLIGNLISMNQATALQNGFLTYTDFTTFNNKQNALTLTTTGTSGAATLVGATLNIPQYTDAYTGTVTSVAALTIGTTGTDLSSSVANSTTTPVITLNVPTASAANRGALSSADWTTFNNKYNLPSLTSGSVLFSNGSTIAQDNANFFWDDTNNRLGIGTSSPAAQLEIKSGTSGFRFFTSTSTSAQMNLLADLGGGYDNAGSIIAAQESTNNSYLAFGTKTSGSLTEKMRINASGNLGLGVTPSAWQTTSGSTAFQFLGSYLYGYRDTNLLIGNNAYYDGTWKYYASSIGATKFNMSNGAYDWSVAPSGTAGTPITFTTALTIASTGVASFSNSLTTSDLSATILSPSLGTNQTVFFELGKNIADTYNSGEMSFKFVASGSSSNMVSLGFYGAGNKLNVLGNGNVLIGTTTDIGALLNLNFTASGNIALNINRSSSAAGYFYNFSIAGSQKQYSYYNGSYVEFAVVGTITATGFYESSDSRLKTLIQDNYQTKGIASITPKLYTKNGKVELGYYAQDFVGILDSAVSKGSDDMLSLSYREVHTAKIYALEQRIKELETK